MILPGDCLAVLPTLEAERFSACVTDPPYGLSFMGKAWDHSVPSAEVWREVYRVLKPGGHLLAFFGTRTYHRGVVAIEDAGFEIRDMIAWVYGSGFPKSLDVSKALDRKAGLLGPEGVGFTVAGYSHNPKLLTTAPSRGYIRPSPKSDLSAQWLGWGTALKPALEPIVVARKPLIGTVAENVLKHGTGALNIDGCRIEAFTPTSRPPLSTNKHEGWKRPWNDDPSARARAEEAREEAHDKRDTIGRWPANMIHDGSEEAVAGFPDTGPSQSGGMSLNVSTQHLKGKAPKERTEHDDSGGSAARFFYCAKPNASERGSFNNHPTVKPVALMRYLIRLVTPPDGEVLDPFLGSGTTGVAADEENVRWVGIERDEHSVEIARRRTAEHKRGLF